MTEALTGKPRPTEVVVDLQHLTFCDSAGLNALVNARNTAARNRRALFLAAPRDQFVCLLELTGTPVLTAPAPFAPQAAGRAGKVSASPSWTTAKRCGGGRGTRS
ncbi:STAS domain-containing protein [Streptomyces sp. NPDC032472]|uniref:STAS domain-containing protein n=1 Tax=Streptomyces sp. NPDC032472 TaxID=3155018 RepID=UPI0033F1421F